MKAFIAALVLFAILTGIAFFSSYALADAAEALAKRADDLAEAPVAERASASEALHEEWERTRFLLSLTISHTELDTPENLFARVSMAAKTEDGDDFLIAVSELTSSLFHIRDLCTISWDNIL